VASRGRNLLLIFSIKIFIIIILYKARGGAYVEYITKKVSKALIKSIRLTAL